MTLDGLLIGVAAFLIIGLFHPLVIKGEYYFSDRIWPVFLLCGLLALAASCLVKNTLASAVLGVFGCSCLWSIRELKEQKERVARGWFPQNPARAEEKRQSSGRDEAQ